jgi:chromate reductase
MSPSFALHIASFAGSLRSASFNRALLENAQELAPDTLTIDIVDIADVPLFNQDVEAQGDPPAVKTFKDAIRDADGLLIATPEYNHGVPGVTKNLIDWASRPPRNAPLNEKPVAIMGASPGLTGTARGQSQLRQAFEFTNSLCMPQPEILVYRAHEKFDDRGRLTDERTREHLSTFLHAFAQWIRRMQHASEIA